MAFHAKARKARGELRTDINCVVNTCGLAFAISIEHPSKAQEKSAGNSARESQLIPREPPLSIGCAEQDLTIYGQRYRWANFIFGFKKLRL